MMNRGNALEPAFLDDKDRGYFIATLGEACAKTTMTLKWIAAELPMRAWTHVSNLLSQRRQRQKNNQSHKSVNH